MKKLLLATALGLSLSCAFLPSQSYANAEKITAINNVVEQRAAYIDEHFGILLSHQERQNLKLALIAKQVTTPEALATGKTSQTIADEASQLYQINDEAMQRQLLIEVESLTVFAEGGGDLRPTCC